VLWIFGIIIVLLMGAVAVVAAGRGDGLGPAYDDRPDVLVPTNRMLNGEDLRKLRLTVSWRGYRTTEVDALLDRLSAELESRDAERREDLPVDPAAESPAVVPADAPADAPVDGRVDAPVEPGVAVADEVGDPSDH
jgi:DivIVA domain-containing protein